MASIADIPFDISPLNCIVPYVYGDMWYDIHRELRVRVAIRDLADRPRESGGIPLTQRTLMICGKYATETAYLNGLNDFFAIRDFDHFRQVIFVCENDNAGRWYLSLAVRRNVANRMFRSLFPGESKTIFGAEFRRVYYRLYKNFDRPFILMLDTPFHQTASLYVSNDLQESSFVRKLIHRPGMVTLFDAFMDPVNRPSFRSGIMLWRYIQVKDDGSICVFTYSKDRC